MSIEALLGIAACALCAAVLGTLVKKSNREYALLLSTVATVLIIYMAVENASPLVEQLLGLAGSGSLQEICLTAMLKAVGLTLIGQLAVYLCKDAGESAIAYGIEVAAKVATLAVAMPLLTRLFGYLGEILKL